MSRSLSEPPSEWAGAQRVGISNVYVNLAATPADTIVWHWCPTGGGGDGRARWVGAAIPLHTIVQRDPLTITRSLQLDCCGWHGFITDGQWVPA